MPHVPLDEGRILPKMPYNLNTCASVLQDNFDWNVVTQSPPKFLVNFCLYCLGVEKCRNFWKTKMGSIVPRRNSDSSRRRMLMLEVELPIAGRPQREHLEEQIYRSRKNEQKVCWFDRGGCRRFLDRKGSLPKRKRERKEKIVLSLDTLRLEEGQVKKKM